MSWILKQYGFKKERRRKRNFSVFPLLNTCRQYICDPQVFKRICSRYSSKRIKIFCFLFILIWSTHNNLLPHIRITYYIILDKNYNSLTKATVSSRKLKICVFILLWHMQLLFFLCLIFLLILFPFLSVSYIVMYV